METYAVKDLVCRVRTAMDENRTHDELSVLQDVDTLLYDWLVCNELESAARQILLVCPSRYLGAVERGSETQKEWLGVEGCYRVSLPADVLRVLSVKADNWLRSVTALLLPGDSAYAQQFSPYAGVRAHSERPAAALVNRGGGVSLEVFGCSGTASVQYAYVSVPRMEGEGAACVLRLPPQTVESIVQTAAGQACARLGMAPESERLLVLGRRLLEKGGGGDV